MVDALLELAWAASGSYMVPAAAIIESQRAKTSKSGSPRGDTATKKVLGPERPVAVDVEETPLALRVQCRRPTCRSGSDTRCHRTPAPEFAEPPEPVCGRWTEHQAPKLVAELKALGGSKLIVIVEKPLDARRFADSCRRWLT